MTIRKTTGNVEREPTCAKGLWERQIVQPGSVDKEYCIW